MHLPYLGPHILPAVPASSWDHSAYYRCKQHPEASLHSHNGRTSRSQLCSTYQNVGEYLSRRLLCILNYSRVLSDMTYHFYCRLGPSGVYSSTPQRVSTSGPGRGSVKVWYWPPHSIVMDDDWLWERTETMSVMIRIEAVSVRTPRYGQRQCQLGHQDTNRGSVS